MKKLLKNKASKLPKMPDGIRIEPASITIANGFNEQGQPIIQLFGLGDDQKVYAWDGVDRIWVIF